MRFEGNVCTSKGLRACAAVEREVLNGRLEGRRNVGEEKTT